MTVVLNISNIFAARDIYVKANNYQLDNPVWHALNQTHQSFSLNYGNLKFYKPDYCPFGALKNNINLQKGITQYATLTNNFFIVGEEPLVENSLPLHNQLICNQMILLNPVKVKTTEQIISLETAQQKSDLFDLVNLVQPGYFKSKTVDLGKYFGIYKNKQLIAVTGERMKMDAYTEVSAVVTHPEHTRKGYAKQLIKHTTEQIMNENKTPYLHVANSNTAAIKLYEKMGFTTRRMINFWHFKM